MNHPADFTATEAAVRLRDGRLTASELMDACIDRIATLDPTLRAFAYFDPKLAMRAAQEQDRKSASGLLHGLPLGVKDVLDTADMPTSYGSPIWTGYRPRADAVAVSLARSAGAIVIGKTASTEFATRKPGATTNPFNAAHTPGGSSSGSAAAVGAALLPFAYGTQTAGSIIRPAAFCGVVGFKPSFGAIHRGGMKVMSETLDTIGVLARSVADCALLVGAITGRELGDPEHIPGKSPKFALVSSPGGVASTDTLDRLYQISDTLRRSGASVTEVKLPVEAEAAFEAHPVVMNMEIAQALAWELQGSSDRMSDNLLQPIRWAQRLSPAALDAGRKTFVEARRSFADWMTEYDAVITPSAIGEAPAGLQDTGSPTFNILWSALYAPCVTVPMGIGRSGLPLGVQIVCSEGQDRSALSWARWIQAKIN